MVSFKVKPIINKANNQITINLPRCYFKKRNPKYIKLNISKKDVEW